MAIDLLEFNSRTNHKTKKPVQHAETHDLESVFWVSYVCALEASIRGTPPDELRGQSTIESHLLGLDLPSPYKVLVQKSCIIMRTLPELDGSLRLLYPYLEEYRERCYRALKVVDGAAMDCDEVDALMTRHIELLQNRPQDAVVVSSVPPIRRATEGSAAEDAPDQVSVRPPSVPGTHKRKRSFEDSEPRAEGASPKRPKTPQTVQSPHTLSKSGRFL